MADFPNNIADFREVKNLEGISYDPTNEYDYYAEDNEKQNN